MSDTQTDLDHPRSFTGTGNLPAMHSSRSSYIATRYVYIHHTHLWRPPTDVYETDDLVRVQAEVAGMEHAEFAVVREGRRLRISGLRTDPPERRVYHQLEIHAGEFLTEVDLPECADVDTMQAQYQDGFMIVEFKKIRPAAAGCGGK